MKISADRPDLTGEDQAVPQIFSFEDVARGHVDFALYYGGHARAAAAFSARVRHIDAGIEQHVDQSLAVWPAKPMPLTVEVDFHVGDFRHEPMVCDRRGTVHLHAHWPGRLARTAR